MLGNKYTAEKIESLFCSCFPLATAYCSEACYRNPVWGSVGSHTQYTVINGRMIHPVLFSNTFPFAVNSIEPDVVDVGHPVMVNVEFADFWN